MALQRCRLPLLTSAPPSAPGAGHGRSAAQRSLLLGTESACSDLRGHAQHTSVPHQGDSAACPLDCNPAAVTSTVKEAAIMKAVEMPQQHDDPHARIAVCSVTGCVLHGVNIAHLPGRWPAAGQ